MAIFTTFIGINKYQDPAVRDLAGARRDAIALWALFNDSVAGIQSSLLYDEHATCSSVRRALAETLDAAGPGDSAIVTFSGHGTRAHGLVAHDTNVTDLSGTTIHMDEFAESFRKSRAGVILLFLDCCFSGAAPGRVLADSPMPRAAALPLQALGWKGPHSHRRLTSGRGCV